MTSVDHKTALFARTGYSDIILSVASCSLQAVPEWSNRILFPPRVAQVNTLMNLIVKHLGTPPGWRCERQITG